MRGPRAAALRLRIRAGPLLPLREGGLRNRPRAGVPLSATGPALLEATDLTKVYPQRGSFLARSGPLRAVDGVSFAIRRGETLGLVGESGSGKSTIGRLLLRLEAPTSGRIRFEGEDWLALSGSALRRRRRDAQIVFQDPQSSLNPRMRAGSQIAEPLRIQRIVPRREIRERVAALLEEVGLPAAAAARFPGEFSGGQRQRIAIARALATRPKFVVCDEPVSALDVSVAAQILNLLIDLRERNGLATLFISHDLAVVSRMSDRIAVMYRGRIVEKGPADDVLRSPRHPYTVLLLSAASPAPPGSPAGSFGEPVEGSAPAAAPRGCAFQPRCPIARPRCRDEVPPLSESSGAHAAACFFPGELSVRPEPAARPPL